MPEQTGNHHNDGGGASRTKPQRK
ncbi:hypothetical protein A2U01_0099839, partial [Trifolium medium]|nr:hypothetical protein [Trifolium medium]